MEKFILPDRWCVKDCSLVSNYASKLHNCKNQVNNTYYYHQDVNNIQISYGFNYIKRDGYTEITIDQFKQYVLKEPNTIEQEDYSYLKPILTKLNIK